MPKKRGRKSPKDRAGFAASIHWMPVKIREQIFQRLWIDRFHEVGIAARLHGLSANLFLSPTTQGNHEDSGSPFRRPDPLYRVEPVHSGKSEVHEDDVGEKARAERQRLETAVSCSNLVSTRAKNVGQAVRVVAIVVDQHDLELGNRRTVRLRLDR